mmetsp:Transcript_6310/g.10617  ORF Transcript_6310/g.10617 Transcript_6310/m.10617 type:complete len:221 (-) Transcript_6310:296-958(-)
MRRAEGKLTALLHFSRNASSREPSRRTFTACRAQRPGVTLEAPPHRRANRWPPPPVPSPPPPLTELALEADDDCSKAFAPGLSAAHLAGTSLRARAHRRQRSASDSPTKPLFLPWTPPSPPPPSCCQPLLLKPSNEAEEAAGEAAAAQNAARTSAPLHSTTKLAESTRGIIWEAATAQSEGPPKERGASSSLVFLVAFFLAAADDANADGGGGGGGGGRA